MANSLNVLVLAGTADARYVIDALCEDDMISMTASLAGATKSPMPMPVDVRTGGFGGAEGMADFCRNNNVDLILDITHPFARHISRNAAIAAGLARIPCIAFDRPAWPIDSGGREFDSWQEMVAAVPSRERVFLAGGTASIEAFRKRHDIFVCARALNVDEANSTTDLIFINAMPQAAVEDEIALFQKHSISLLCCKNSGGVVSNAKLEAARALHVPVWMLARRPHEKNVPNLEIHDKLDDVISAVKRLSAQNCV